MVGKYSSNGCWGAGWISLFCALTLLASACSDEDEPSTKKVNKPNKPEVEAGAHTQSSQPAEAAAPPSAPEPDAAAGASEETSESEAARDAGEATDTDAPRIDAGPTETPITETSGPESDASTGEPPPSTFEAGSTETDQPEPPGVPVIDPTVWLFADTGVVINVASSAAESLPVAGYVESVMVGVWSTDGRWLADNTADPSVISFYDLEEAGAAGESVTLPGPGVIQSWAGRRGVLVSVSVPEEGDFAMLVTPEGDATPLMEPRAPGVLSSLSGSPDGRTLIFSTAGQGGFALFAVDMTDLDAVKTPRLLQQSTTAPPMMFTWSLDSNWFAWGVPGAAPPISLWSPRGDMDPVAGVVEGGGYSPLFSFSPSSEAFVSHATISETDSLLSLIPLETSSSDGEVVEASVGEMTTLDSGASVTPATWSPDGASLVYGTGELGWHHSVAGGEVGERSELPGWGYGCGMAWLDLESMIYDHCQESPRAATLAQLGESMSLEPIDLGVYAGFAAGGRCVAVWNEGELRVGKAELDARLLPVVEGADLIERGFVDPDGRGVAWVTGGVVLHWQPLTLCAPAGESTEVTLTAPGQRYFVLPN